MSELNGSPLPGVGFLVVFLLLPVAAFLPDGCATSGLDPYFASTRSDANVYVSPAKSGISKIAVLPFKGLTEHVGASVSDMVVIEMLRKHMYVLVERSQPASPLNAPAGVKVSDMGLREATVSWTKADPTAAECRVERALCLTILEGAAFGGRHALPDRAFGGKRQHRMESARRGRQNLLCGRRQSGVRPWGQHTLLVPSNGYQPVRGGRDAFSKNFVLHRPRLRPRFRGGGQ